MKIKSGLSNFSVGTWTPAAVIGNEAAVYANVSLGVRKAVIERPWEGARRADEYSGMVDSTSSSSPADFPHTSTPVFPIIDGKWRMCAPDLLTETDRNIDLCRKQEKEKCSEIGTRGIIRDGPYKVRAVGWMVEAARKLQLSQPEKLTETRPFAESAQHLYPEIASAVIPIYRNGGSPKYEALPPKAVPDDGNPHGPRSSKEITESEREESICLKAIVCARKDRVYQERQEYIPTTAPPYGAPIDLSAGNREPFPTYVVLTWGWAMAVSSPSDYQR